MLKERFIDFSQSFHNRRVCCELLSHVDEGTDDINTHGHGVISGEDVRCLQGTVLGKDARQFGAAAAGWF